MTVTREGLAEQRWHVLVPFDAREAATLLQAAKIAGNKSPRTISNWCEAHGLGRKIGDTWSVSRVALAMYLDGATRTLENYLAGDRQSDDVVGYFVRAGVPQRK